MKEVKEVTNKQISYFRSSNAEDQLVDQSLGDLVQYFVGKNDDKMNKEA